MQIILRDDASGTAVDLLLRVDEDEDGRPRWSEFRAPELPPKQTRGTLSWTSLDPLKDFVWAQDSFHKGAMQPYYRAEDPHRYAYSENIDLRWEGVATLSDVQLPYTDGSKKASGSPLSQGDIIIRNSGAELGATTHWTAGTGVTLTADTDERTGQFAFKIVTDGSRTAGDVLMRQDVEDANSPIANWRSKTISTASAFIKRTSGSESGARVEINDDVTGDTEGGAITSSTYSQSTASTHAVDGSAARVRIQIAQTANETGAHTFFVDDFAMIPDAGTLVASMPNLNHVGYFARGKCVFNWDEADDVWRMGDFLAADVTDLIEFNGKIYAALGYSTAYEESSDKITWTPNTGTGNKKFAKFWAIARNSAGSEALWKSETSSSVNNTVDPADGGTAWGTAISVGSTSPVITRLFGAFDTLVVGKEDGLYTYVRFDVSNSAGDNLFINVAPDFAALQDEVNFSRGATWVGWLWLKTVRQGLVRWRPGELQIVTFLRAPRIDNVGGVVLDMVSDAEQLWVLIGTSITQSAQTYLISIRLDPDGGLLMHTVQTLVGVTTFEDNAVIGVTPSADVGTTPVWLQVIRAGTEPFRWRIDTTDPVPYRAGLNDDGGEVYTGQLFTSIWHGGMPDTPKAFLALTVWVQDVGASDTIAAAFALEGSTSFTSLGTFNGSGTIQTLYFNGISTPATNAIGRMIQLRFTWSQSAGGTPPKMFAFALHSTLRPPKLRTWEIFIRVQDEAILDTGYHNPIHLTKVLADLTTLEDQTYPIYFREDIDEDGTFVNTTVHLLDRQRVSVEPTYEVHRIILQEAITAA